jgi:DNA modification methylase
MEFVLHGWEAWPQPLIWNKTNGMLPRPDAGPRKTYETILMFLKGSPRFHKVGAPDVLTIPQREELSHGAQKPVDLYIELIARSCLPGARILDAFAGSGTVFPAATRTKCVATGFEISNEYYNLALSRMSQTDTFTLEELGL